jgi:hypothetical protein
MWGGRSRVWNPPTAWCMNNLVICDFGWVGGWLTSGVLSEFFFCFLFLKSVTSGVLSELFFLFPIFKISFLKKSLSCVFLAHDKEPLYRCLFVVCLLCFLFLKSVFWKNLCRVFFWHTTKSLITDVYLPCVLCRVQHTAKSLLWVFWHLPCVKAHGKLPDSRSDDDSRGLI